MAAPVLLCLLLALSPPVSAAGAGAGGVGEGPAAPARAYQPPRCRVLLPDTAKARALRPDTTRTAAPAAPLTPDAAPADDADAALTPKSTLFIVAAMAVLTLTTLLLYNVRSR